ncbi:hypothetical protein ACQPZ2_20885 [Nocardia pseudovaccinii]
MARSRRSGIPVEDKVRVVLSVLVGETSAAGLPAFPNALIGDG